MSKTLSFDKIKAGLQKIQDSARIETTCEIYGMSFRLRTLSSVEQRQIAAYSAAFMQQFDDEEEDSDDDGTQMLGHLQNFVAVRKIEALAYSVTQIDDLDLRGIDYIETGQVSEEGTPYKVQKHVFLREVLNDLDLAVIDTLHKKYLDLLTESEIKAAEKVTFRDPEDELEKVEARRRELLQELGREDELEAPAREDSNSSESDPNLAENLRDMAFQTVEDEEQILQERVVKPSQDVAEEPHDENEDEDEMQETSYPKEMEVGGSKFVRLDDPDTPYSEEEQAALEEQERLYRQRQGTEEEPNEAAQMLQKRKRVPLNQTNPEIQEGMLPSEKQVSRPTRTRKNEVDPDSLPLAEGYSREDAAPLTRKPQASMDESKLNPPPKGGQNPNFKG